MQPIRPSAAQVLDVLEELLCGKYRARCERNKRFVWLQCAGKQIVAAAYFGPPLHCLFAFDPDERCNRDRGRTLAKYPANAPLGFSFPLYQELCASSRRKSTPQTRRLAREDAALDLLPPKHGLNPTLRLAETEVREGIHGPVTDRKLRVALNDLLEKKLSLHVGTTFQQLLDHPSGKPFVPQASR